MEHGIEVFVYYAEILAAEWKLNLRHSLNGCGHVKIQVLAVAPEAVDTTCGI